MTAAVPRVTRMTAAEFLEWSADQPGKWELEAGVPVRMMSERMSHADTKGECFVALRSAIRQAGLPCRAHIDGVGIQVDDNTVYIPDAFVECDPPRSDDPLTIDTPIIVVEVVSPSSSRIDAEAKLEAYFRLPSVQHYLLVKIDRRAVIHHARSGDGPIQTRILQDGFLTLDPPGLTLQIADLFPAV